MKEVIIGGMASFMAAFTTWFFARRKQSAEIDGVKIDNMIKAHNAYGKIVDDLVSKIERLITENQALKEEVDNLKNIIKSLENHA